MKTNLRIVGGTDVAERHLPVLTMYYRGTEVVRRNRAGKPLRAVELCVGHMRRNEYEATAAEVYHSEEGHLYAVMRLSVDGNLRILFQAKLKKDE